MFKRRMAEENHSDCISTKVEDTKGIDVTKSFSNKNCGNVTEQ